MNRLSTTLVIVLALSLSVSKTARSQAASKVFADLTTDSTAWQRVLDHIIRTLSPQLVAAAADPTAQPWRLQLPANDPQEQLLATQLRTVLRARQIMPADTLVRSLELGRLLIANDTARVEVRFEQTQKCPGTSRTTGFGWSTTVLVPREPKGKFWGAAFSRIMRGGDRLPC